MPHNQQNKPFNALIVSSDSNRRSRLKMAVHYDQLQGNATFKTVHTACSLKEALKKLAAAPVYEILLICDCFNSADIELFLANLSQLSEEKFGIVLVLKSADQEKATIADQLMKGVDGCLYEPFSVEMVSEITKIAALVRKQNMETRLSSATDMVVDSMSSEIDRKATEISSGTEAKPFSGRLQAVSKMFRSLSEKDMLKFFERLCTVTETSNPKTEYTGPSEILKKKMAKKKQKEEEEKEKEEEKEGGEAEKPSDPDVQIIHR